MKDFLPLDNKITACYCRLSKEDDREDESLSIENQRAIITAYADERGFANCKFYIDDGFTGTNFEREAFEQLITDIEARLVRRVIVKDVSRFGRRSSMVGYYIDVLFPEYDVEFFSVSEPDNETLPIHNFVNEFYARDTSKKIRAVFRQRGLSGRPLANKLPYGYTKGDNGNWIIDTPAAEVVRRIFVCYVNERIGINEITRQLTEEKIPTPGSHLSYKNGFKDGEERFDWNQRTVSYIISNQSYCGDVVNFKSEKESYKSKRHILFDRDDYVVFYDVHPPIIEREIFESARELWDKRRKVPRLGRVDPFRGLLFCCDCGSVLYVMRRQDGKDRYICNMYTKSKGFHCSPHSITIEHLTKLVGDKLRLLATISKADFSGFCKEVSCKTTEENRAAQSSLQCEISENESAISDLQQRLRDIYIEMKSGIVSREAFSELSERFVLDIGELKSRRTALLRNADRISKKRDKVKAFLETLSRIDKVDDSDLTEKFLNSLIEKIIISERVKRKSRAQPEFEIHYHGVGAIDYAELQTFSGTDSD